MQVMWIKKLTSSKTLAAKIPNAALKIIGIEATDLLHAADWELKIVAHHLEKKFALSFWAAIIQQITELRWDLNIYINQDNLDIEVTTEIDNKRIAKRITQNLKKR